MSFRLRSCISRFGHAVVFAFLLLASVASAATIRVPEDEPTIQLGLLAASVGDTVDVACGTYYESKVGIPRGVTLRSRTGTPTCVTIDAERNGAVVKFDGADIPTRIEGFTLANGLSPAVGGISIVYSTDVEIHRCVIRDNGTSTARNTGAAIYAYYASFRATYTEIVRSTPNTEFGSATIRVIDGLADLRNCTLVNNSRGVINGPGTFDRCVFVNNQFGPPAGTTCSCVWPQSTGGTNFTADPLFCDAANDDYRLGPGSPCLPGENDCGLVGAHSLGCGTPAQVPVTVDTSPSGLPVVVDGVTHTGPADFLWTEYSRHVVSAFTTPGSGGTRYRWDTWSDGGSLTHEVWIPTGGTTITAEFFPQHHLTVAAIGGGTVSAADGWYDEGTPLSVEAFPDPGAYHLDWLGNGNGSYSGTDNPAAITIDSPVVQTAEFKPISFDFTISASATDPFETRAVPTQGNRPLYLWLTCSNAGIAAFEAAVSGNLFPSVFIPENGVLNAGSPTSLLLAIPGCPVDDDVPMRLGHWMVGDGGGTFCLTKSPTTNRITGVDCDATPGVILLPRVVGFSSDDSQVPCAMGTDRCGSPNVPAAYVTVDAPLPSGGATALAVSGPNPFGEGTRFSFALDREAVVRMSVYDILGRRVRTLSEGRLPAGPHDIAWDGADGDGFPLPSGVYLVRLERDGASETKKVTRIRTR